MHGPSPNQQLPTMPGQQEKIACVGGWRATFILLLAIAAARVIYLIRLCPYELVADEAQYWDWSRRLDLSYYSKGPGIAWLIAASTRLFGDSEWSVRLPSVAASLVTGLAIAAMAYALKPASRGAGFYAALLFCLIPGYQATSLLMTIDGPYMMCWVVAALAAWRAFESIRTGGSSLTAWLGLAVALGVGFLFKYTILLLIPGLIVFALLKRRAVGWNTKTAFHLMVAVIVFAACVSPVFIWNHRHGWPTVRHLLGHLDLPGSDHPAPSTSGSYSPLWVLDFLGSQIALIGPAMGLLIFAGVRVFKNGSGTAGDQAVHAKQFMLCCAAPILMFYFLISLVHKTEGNWPIAGYLTLIAPAGALAADELPRYRQLVRDWIALPVTTRPKRGFLRRKPETIFQVAWHWTIGFGIIACPLILFLPYFATFIPGRIVPVGRFAGQKELARQVQQAIEGTRSEAGQIPFVVADDYGITSRLAFYLPGRPVVYSASSRLGGRKTSYDYFSDTDLTSPSLFGKAVVIVDDSSQRWVEAFEFDSITTTKIGQPTGLKVFIGLGYRGPRWGRGITPAAQAQPPLTDEHRKPGAP